jgi:TonB-linked SusC/RagA family outer membrane protein
MKQKSKISNLMYMRILFCIVLFLYASLPDLKGATSTSKNNEYLFEQSDFPENEQSGNHLAGSEFQQQNIIKGKVTDQGGRPLPGVTIVVVGTTRGVITNNDGTYTIDAKVSDRLAYSFIGMESQIIEVGSRNSIDVQMGEKIDELEEVTIVAFGKQRKESVISSIETIKSEDLRIPSSNLTTAFAGRMAGMISYQVSGEPGLDDAQFFIRGITSFGAGKVDPLILMDNVEVTSSDLSRLHPDDIASFSILKDATATTLYGARGANGVILITTKEGKEGSIKVSARIENSFSTPTKEIEMADPITYMNLANEAARTRDALGVNPYSQHKIDNTMAGTNPYAYPTADWMDILFKDAAINQRANVNISGGGKIARYYVAGSVSQDNGILKEDKVNNFNNNIDLKKYLVRSNINLNLTNTTEGIIRVHGTFEDYSGPVRGGSDLYKLALNVSPVRFPAFYEPDETYSHAKHTLFGGYGEGQYLNPYAEMVKGFRESNSSTMMAQIEIKQDFGQWIDGLTGRIMANTQRYSKFDLMRSFNPFYYTTTSYNRKTGDYKLYQLNPLTGTEYLSYQEGGKTVNSSMYSEASMTYNKLFQEKHDVSGMLILMARNSLNGNAGSLAESLPQRNLGLAGRFTYGYDSRYLAEFNFGYNGSEKFDSGHRWGFFPSFGLGWIVSNESFWQGSIANTISKLKIRGTYGLVGNDAIGNERFFYLSQVNINQGGNYTLGYNYSGINRNGTTISHYANPLITWEIAYKQNLGLEVGLFNGKIDILADLYKEHRINILQTRADVPSTMGLWSTPKANVGEAEGGGVDISLDYNHSFRNGLWVVARGNYTYARSTYKFYEEPDFESAGVPWRSRIGHPISQQWGYIAERLFIDDADVENSPRQEFGEFGAGDIKYRDLNKDNLVNELDLTPIGYPTTPEINYGFGISSGYKNFDFSFFFQGSARSSFWIDAYSLTPFISYSSGGQVLETGLAKFIADDYWSELSPDPQAGWPRLSNYRIPNNTQRSSMFMEDGSFLRLKSVECGYSVPKRIVNGMKMDQVRFYLSGSNLLLFSGFDLWDVEMGGNGLGYPLQKVVNVGLNISF